MLSLTLRWPTGGLRSFSAGALRLHKQKTALRSRGDPEGRLESIAVHDDAPALLNRTSGELFRGRRFTPPGFHFTLGILTRARINSGWLNRSRYKQEPSRSAQTRRAIPET